MKRRILARSLLIVLAVAMLTILEASLPHVQAEALGPWASASAYPASLYGESCATYLGYLYCVGGWTSTGVTAAVRFNHLSIGGGLTGVWTSTTSYPTTITGESCVIYSGYIYCVGGRNAAGGITSAVYYAPVTSGGVGTWKSTTHYPTIIGFESCAISSGHIYCVGGYRTSTGETNAVYYANLYSGGVGPWSSTTTYPTNIQRESCVINSDYIICVGGDASGVFTNAVYYALASGGAVGTWHSTTNYPTTITAESCAIYSSYIYCVGGRKPGPYTQSFVYYAHASGGVGAWSSTTTYPTNIDGESCVIYSGYIYCVGGFTGFVDTNAVSYASTGTLQVSQILTDVVSAAPSTAWFVMPDYTFMQGSPVGHTSASKCGGVGAAAITDIYAATYIFGALTSYQAEILDTNGADVYQINDANCGKPLTSSYQPLVAIAGPLANLVVHYYESSGTSPLYYRFADGCIVRRDIGSSIDCSSPTATNDVFLIEAFKDSTGRNVYILYGRAWPGTLAATEVLVDFFLKNPDLTASWYVLRWQDASSGISANSIPDAGDVFTPIAST